MNITIIGTGFVGVVSSAVFASFGHQVFGLDIDQAKIDKLNQAKIPFFEPGLETLVRQVIKKGNLSFTTDYKEAISNSEIILIAVGTPSAPDGQADLSYVYAATKSLAPYLADQTIIAVKSTVPPGTCDKVGKIVSKLKPKVRFFVASLPEFLREGSAVQDTLHPDRVIIGALDPFVIDKLSKLHKSFSAPIVVMKPNSAQMCKYTGNAYLATRITFINQIANLCEVNGANILEVIEGIGLDKRIGKHYWYPGFGYGGSCFPKDVKELAAYARAVKHEDNLMVTVSHLNETRIPKLLTSYERKVGGFDRQTIAVLGLSFKPNTDDLREAPSLKVIPYLLDKGAKVRAYDPMATEAARQFFKGKNFKLGENFQITDDLVSAIDKADIIFVLIEWPQFTSLDANYFSKYAKPGAVFIDARDQFDPESFRKAGLKYFGVGIQNI